MLKLNPAVVAWLIERLFHKKFHLYVSDSNNGHLNPTNKKMFKLKQTTQLSPFTRAPEALLLYICLHTYLPIPIWQI